MRHMEKSVPEVLSEDLTVSPPEIIFNTPLYPITRRLRTEPYPDRT